MLICSSFEKFYLRWQFLNLIYVFNFRAFLNEMRNKKYQEKAVFSLLLGKIQSNEMKLLRFKKSAFQVVKAKLNLHFFFVFLPVLLVSNKF